MLLRRSRREEGGFTQIVDSEWMGEMESWGLLVVGLQKRVLYGSG